MTYRYMPPTVNSYVPMDYPDIAEYVPNPPDYTQPVPLAPAMPIMLDAFDVEPSPTGEYLDKQQVIAWAVSVMQECANEPKAIHRLTQLVSWLIDD